jgi:HPt (histidine-containing phosphotransfer) domain-containing protein
MAQPATHAIHPLPGATVIDLGHLARMTFGDRSLEREVLQLFDRQAELLLARMRSGAPPAIGALAHTLRGSASGIGADSVAKAARAVEQAGNAERLAAMDSLEAAIGEARVAINELLHD